MSLLGLLVNSCSISRKVEPDGTTASGAPSETWPTAPIHSLVPCAVQEARKGLVLEPFGQRDEENDKRIFFLGDQDVLEDDRVSDLRRADGTLLDAGATFRLRALNDPTGRGVYLAATLDRE